MQLKVCTKMNPERCLQSIQVSKTISFNQLEISYRVNQFHT